VRGDRFFTEPIFWNERAIAHFQSKTDLLKNCPNNDVFERAEEITKQQKLGVSRGNYATAFERAEEIAKGNKAGVWSQSGIEKPWDYRRRYR
jgi:endonuclease YncB( thermonuclease family)